MKLRHPFQSWQVTLGEGDDAFTLLGVHPRAPVDLGGVDLARASTPPSWRPRRRPTPTSCSATSTPPRTTPRCAPGGTPAAATRCELTNDGLEPTWPANGISPAPGLRLPALIQIDHVLVGHRFASTDGSEIVEIDGTDHRAVVATVARR